MKKTKLLMCVMFLSIAFIGCERWGGGMDNLESDRPSDVGPEYGKRGNGGSTDLGSIYGDLLYILRNEDGTPVYKHGYVQPLAFVNGEPFIYEENGVEVQYVCAIDAEEGEIIPNTYIDEYGVECKFPDDGNVYGPQEVEFGRTSIFRAPQRVMDQALVEAMKGLAEVDVNTLQVDFCGRLFGIRPDGTEKTIDSPRENMAVYQSIMNNCGYAGLIAVCEENGYQHLADHFYNWDYEWLHCAAGCISAANDKTGTVHVNKIQYINRFKNLLGCTPISDELDEEYYNFSDFSYTRDVWDNVKIGFLVWNGEYNAEEPVVFNVNEIFDGWVGPFGYGNVPAFTIRSQHSWARYEDIGGFAQFADDCNQVLEYVHEDSNIVWVR